MPPIIHLRKLKAIDKPYVFELLLDAEVMRFIGPRKALSRLEAEKWFNTEMTTAYRYVVALSATDEFVGFCGMKKIDGIMDFGYFIRQKYWGKGYIQLACELVLNELSKSFDISHFQVFIANDNLASLAIARKMNWLPLQEASNNFGEKGHYFQLVQHLLIEGV
ncbi:GNAT family N-acetyltransferase [Psychromonas sp. psych-6C06]|uniref:GNAT family N-acetyltransferase n=1 Tax=Psychromonas sp. psych-6C06 TaxID=2058089 RepID=UPI000C3238A6|nr:GNAT family N-acetyltransferase [Psychromonas sp. psych-6C06]PKF60736.1 GNAT family N-acetyltransferase [Psychromonas sp. psych-6C06]